MCEKDDEKKVPFQDIIDNPSIDIEPLENIGLTQRHIEQIQTASGLTDEVIQNSIYAFAFDLEENNKAEKIRSGTPLNYFVGTLRKGKPYLPPSNYESPHTRALKRFTEVMKKDAEKKEKLENEIIEHLYLEWSKTLHDEDIINIIPEKRWRDDKSSNIYKSFLKNHFIEQKWPLLKKEKGL